jgi:hypothetical protein
VVDYATAQRWSAQVPAGNSVDTELAMDILFRKSGFSREPSVATRSDGVRLSIPVFGRLDPIPHDLAHFVIELELDLQNGFFGSIADGAVFGGMHVLSGRQPPHAGERSGMVMKANHYPILLSEILVDMTLQALKGETVGIQPLPITVPQIPSSTRAEREALIQRLVPQMQEMCMRWQAVPMGESHLVVWPDHSQRHGNGSQQQRISEAKVQRKNAYINRKSRTRM